MSRAAVILRTAAWLASVAAGLQVAAAVNPHVDPTVTSGGCAACHDGHGASRSPMLPGPQVDACLSCHGTPQSFQEMIALGMVASSAELISIEGDLQMPYTHRIDPAAFSRRQANVVVCTSCHSPHRGAQAAGEAEGRIGQPRLSPRDPNRYEFELCEECHGSAGAATQDLSDISRLLSPENRSYHPVQAPAVEESPSVVGELAGRQISCTDCHGSADPRSPRGVHGSRVAYLLLADYTTTDGSEESPTSAALCYRCHDREAVLEGSAFPQHREHIVDERASCATCHNAHGSVGNRALIRFGEETTIGGVSPSVSSGRLEFVSDGPGSGACYLSCHGEDHGPEAYGGAELMLKLLGGRERPFPRAAPARPADRR